VNRKDKRRVNRRKQQELHDGKKATKGAPPPTPDPSHTPAPATPAQVQAVAEAVAPLPSNLKPWPPGVSGNPGGYSRGRRYSDDLNAYIAEIGAVRVVSKLWFKRLMDSDPKFFKFLLDHCQDQASKDRDPIDAAALPIEPVDDTIDPAVGARMTAALAERLMAAADPTTVPILEEDDEIADVNGKPA
jgi:hypothetical protein